MVMLYNFSESPMVMDNPLTDKQLRDVIHSEEESIALLVKLIYIDSEKYHNIYINNIKSNNAMIYNDNMWSSQQLNKILETLIKMLKLFLLEYIEENRFILNKVCVKNINNYFKLLEVSDNLTRLMKDLKYILINGRKDIKHTYLLT